MFEVKKIMGLLIAVTMLALTACGGGGAAASPAIDPGAVYTAAVETAYVQLTLTAMAGTSTPAQPAATYTPIATNTPLVTNNPLMTNTPLGLRATNTPFSLTAGPTKPQCDTFSYLSDDGRDGEVMAPGETFLKTWYILNTGPCTWDDGYGIAPGWGELANGSVWTGIPYDILPGESLDISVYVTAPLAPGTYDGAWRMQTDRGYNFGIALTARIIVAVPEP